MCLGYLVADTRAVEAMKNGLILAGREQIPVISPLSNPPNLVPAYFRSASPTIGTLISLFAYSLAQ